MTALFALCLAGALTYVLHDTLRALPTPLLLLVDLAVFAFLFVKSNRLLKELKQE